MKSIVLLFWVLAANGQQNLLPVRHFDTEAGCTAEALALTEHYDRQGEKTRYRCHRIVPEVAEVDEHGNPIETK